MSTLAKGFGKASLSSQGNRPESRHYRLGFAIVLID